MPNLMVKVSSSPLSAGLPYFDENVRGRSRQDLGASLLLKKLRTWLPKMWTCVFLSCVFRAISLRILFTHLNLVHSDDEFQVICGLGTHQVAKKFSISATIFTNTFVESTTMFTKVTPFLRYTGITLSCQLKKETRTVCNTQLIWLWRKLTNLEI